MPKRLKLPHLEQKPKEVHRVEGWRVAPDLKDDPEVAAAVVQITRCIENGTPLPSGYYSKLAGRARDGLLEREGIMHLHLRKSNSEELLWLVQYEDDVVFLELGDHQPFEARPPGSVLAAYHAFKLKKKEGELAARPSVRARRLTFGERRRKGLVKVIVPTKK